MKELTKEYIEKRYKNETNERRLRHRDLLLKKIKKRDDLRGNIKVKEVKSNG